MEALETGDQETSEEIIIGEFDKDSEEEQPDKETDSEESEDDSEESDDNQTGDEAEEPNELDTLRAELEKARKDRDRAFYKLRQQSQQKPDDKKSETESHFSDAQLVQLIAEHNDEPEILLQIMKQVNKQEGKQTAEATVKAQEIKQRRAEIEKWMSENVPDVLDNESEHYQQVTNARSMLHLDDHPFGDFLGVAAQFLMAYPQTVEQIKKEARESALKEKGETTRKKTIKENTQSGGKPKTKPAVGDDKIDAQVKEMTKRLNFSKEAAENYRQMLMKNANRVVVEG